MLMCNVFLILFGVCMGNLFRADYDFYEEADGWLKYHVIPAVWQEARLRCQAEGAVLASPLTHELEAAILDATGNHCAIFTGIHAFFSKGDYASIEGVPLSHLPITWAPGQPNNYNNLESCIVMHWGNQYEQYSDERCDEPRPYVCYRKRTHPHVISECGTHDKEYNLDKRTGSCYKFHRRGLTWSRGYMTCAAEGAYLAIINSDQEAEVLRDIYARYPDSAIEAHERGSAAVGFHDWGEHGTWLTIHGQTLDEAGYTKWDNGQPDNSTHPRSGDKGEFCGSIHRNGQFNDVWCNVAIPFICELPFRGQNSEI